MPVLAQRERHLDAVDGDAERTVGVDGVVVAVGGVVARRGIVVATAGGCRVYFGRTVRTVTDGVWRQRAIRIGEFLDQPPCGDFLYPRLPR
ncbi:hypothetical protein [Halomarina oriensis]|uniref:Uncharacterized protein n=1 Tax=Halomarina oriensis TaxID=671145 RepID=A0A6B0GVY8_9EURY|nr:hypothetical protein [Halomarina oriensis]MWG36743.1 hypothetical protein [Halomarina oriensis]